MLPDLFEYELPAELIALHPPTDRDGGRLLVIDPTDGRFAHLGVRDLPSVLPRDCLLVRNDTRVFRARLHGRKKSGGAVELLLVRLVSSAENRCQWLALSRSNKALKQGEVIEFGAIQAHLLERRENGEGLFEFDKDPESFDRIVEEIGAVPLPPYIRRELVADDAVRYQTIYARQKGSVAAPTAGLHFTQQLFDELQTKNIEIASVTLHVGPGTFRPITTGNIAEHKMDAEQYIIDDEAALAIHRARNDGRAIIAVGTTVTRALEGAIIEHGEIVPCRGFTNLFITPGFRFRVIDGLMTNFHLPRSTLLCLVAALAGEETISRAYAIAIEQKYRFYSYGDAMLILPHNR